MLAWKEVDKELTLENRSFIYFLKSITFVLISNYFVLCLLEGVAPFLFMETIKCRLSMKYYS